MDTITRPDPRIVGERAAEILAAVQADEEFDRLTTSTALYPDCWATFTGYPIICEWNLDADSAPLFTEALRVLALKSAVYELTDGDEQLAELPVSAPVDEMVHAVIAQFTVCVRIMARTGVSLVHMTDRERFGWNPGDYTEDCYQAAGWGTPPGRYWISAHETERRLKLLGARYRSIGIRGGGRSHTLDFGLGTAEQDQAGQDSLRTG
jgi:hypothetical protein